MRIKLANAYKLLSAHVQYLIDIKSVTAEVVISSSLLYFSVK